MEPDSRCISDGHLEGFRRKDLHLVGGQCNWYIRSLKEFMQLKLYDLIAPLYNKSYKHRDFYLCW
jgi:hypothetical protein